jgi:type II secretory pathway pseudopilin PulG
MVEPDGARAGERGYSLLELTVCVALLVAGCVVALALLPALARRSQAEVMRGAATEVARNAIERVRAAAAYYPAGGVSDPATRAVTTADHAWALLPAASYLAAARVRGALCGSGSPATDVPMNVALQYDAPSDTLTVAVAYPPDPCTPSAQATVTLAAQLAPASYAPQTVLQSALADPAQQ